MKTISPTSSVTKKEKEVMTLHAVETIIQEGAAIEDPSMYYWELLALEKAVTAGLVDGENFLRSVVGHLSLLITLTSKETVGE